jgi:2-hydroxy-3-keto-5-methylthiopentenyl-1-phosphate phosphatase
MCAANQPTSDNFATSGARSRAIVLDFDGTITEIDLLDEMARRFGDQSVFSEVEDALLSGKITLQECITREFEPVILPLPEMVAWVLESVRIRPGLKELADLAESKDWDIRILSSGFVELIEPMLRDVGLEGIDVVANRVDARPEGWRVIWRDEAVCPVCGEACKRRGLPAADEIVYIGDGISDRCAALASDRVFAVRGLARYLEEIGVPYESFTDFHDVVRALGS